VKRFADTQQGLSFDGGPGITQAWSVLNDAWRQDNAPVQAVLGDVNRRIDRRELSARHFAIEAELAVSIGAPQVFEAINGLRNAMTYLDDNTIAWWHCYGPKPVRRLEPDLLEGIVVGDSMVEDGYAYSRLQGRVLGSEVGFSNVFQDMGVWVEVEHYAERPYKVYHAFQSMFGIEIEPAI
jgi:hypothetical protein